MTDNANRFKQVLGEATLHLWPDLPRNVRLAAERHSETIPSIRQKVRDLRGKLSLRVGFRETCDVHHFASFWLSEPRRKQDRKLRILAAHFSG